MNTLGATIMVLFGYDDISITLTPRNWARVKGGKPLSIRGNGCYSEGTFAWDYWEFGRGLIGSLCVYYGNDGATAFDDELRDAVIIEKHIPKPKRLGRRPRS